MTEIIEAEVIDDSEDTGALVPTGSPTLAVTPTVGANELVQRLDVIQEAADTAMVVDVDYGTVPGTNKPTLLKPGAEKLSVLFQLDIQIQNEKVFDGDHLTVMSKATAYHAPDGTRVGYGEGLCSTREKKYAVRRGERVCPSCGKPAIIKGREEYGGGWLCFAKKDGCGAKFADDDQQITGQQVGDIPNPDLPDLWNTVVKMAQKRARVDAVLAVTGASALFTQDVEDLPRPDRPVETPQQTAPKQTQPAAPRGPAQKLGELLEKYELPDDAVEAVRGWVTAAPGQFDLDRVGEAVKILESEDVPKLLRKVGAE